MGVILDHSSGIEHARSPAMQSLWDQRWGIQYFAHHMREIEREKLKPEVIGPGHTLYLQSPHPFVYGCFNWFSTALIAYLRQVSLFETMHSRGWNIDD